MAEDKEPQIFRNGRSPGRRRQNEPAPCHPERKWHARGMCRGCYDAWRFAKNPELKVKRDEYMRDYKPKHHLIYKDKINARNREKYKDLDIHFSFDMRLRSKYKISADDYRNMVSAQDGVCAICKKPPRSKKYTRLYVDHCHDTGRVRGLLCPGCNTALGQFYHDTAVFGRAIEYLEEGRRRPFTLSEQIECMRRRVAEGNVSTAMRAVLSTLQELQASALGVGGRR